MSAEHMVVCRHHVLLTSAALLGTGQPKLVCCQPIALGAS